MEIKEEIRAFIARQYMPDAPVNSLSDCTPLITSGIIDSIGMLGLVDFIEGHYKIEFMPREIDIHTMDTINQIELLIRGKLLPAN